MKHNKKYYANAVQATLTTITEMYCVMGDESLEDIVKMFNSANMIAAIWDLVEIEYIKNFCKRFNEVLESDDSQYRIYNQNYDYKLVKVVSR